MCKNITEQPCTGNCQHIFCLGCIQKIRQCTMCGKDLVKYKENKALGVIIRNTFPHTKERDGRLIVQELSRLKFKICDNNDQSPPGVGLLNAAFRKSIKDISLVDTKFTLEDFYMHFLRNIIYKDVHITRKSFGYRKNRREYNLHVLKDDLEINSLFISIPNRKYFFIQSFKKYNKQLFVSYYIQLLVNKI